MDKVSELFVQMSEILNKEPDISTRMNAIKAVWAVEEQKYTQLLYETAMASTKEKH